MIKRYLSILLIISTIFFTTGIYAMGSGYLNIVTGKPQAKIYVDGKFIANDYVNRHLLEEGQHYVRIEYAGKLMYAKMVQIRPGKVKTITSEHFVDIKTSVVSRGAMDREVMRLKETKGNFGIGAMYGMNLPASGMSIKWLLFGPFGVQASAIGGLNLDDEKHTQAGVRLLYNLGDKIFFDSVFNGYLATGISYHNVEHSSDSSKSYKAYNGGINMGLELALFDPLYFSAEIGTVYQKRDASSEGTFHISWAGGVHVFF
ncbi:hypothetical protein ACFLZV_03255 [Candidatus Margulisiibacteriota bacterium]